MPIRKRLVEEENTIEIEMEIGVALPAGNAPALVHGTG